VHQVVRLENSLRFVLSLDFLYLPTIVPADTFGVVRRHFTSSKPSRLGGFVRR
jgi:hypothetical protein